MRSAFCLLALTVATSARADILNYRGWLDANPSTPNSTANAWFGTQGVNGSMMTSNGSWWSSPGFPNDTPVLGLRTSVGSDNGAAGPATFAGAWAHPGPVIAAVLVFEPTIATWIGGVDVRSELIANGLSGNGVVISVFTTISSNTALVGSSVLSASSIDQLDTFLLPSLTLFQPGDRVHVAFSDNGSYLFDHVNFDASITVPTPGAIGAMSIAALAALRRRRRG